MWGQRSAFILQLLNLTCVLGFMTSPLIVKPFLHTASAGGDGDGDGGGHNKSLFNISEVAAYCSSHNSSNASTALCDVTVTSHGVVTSHGAVTSHGVVTPHGVVTSRGVVTSHGAVTSRVVVKSHGAVTQVFVIVAVYSLLVALLMLAIFIKDYLAQRRHVQLNGGGILQMSVAAETDDSLHPTPGNTTSQCECVGSAATDCGGGISAHCTAGQRHSASV